MRNEEDEIVLDNKKENNEKYPKIDIYEHLRNNILEYKKNCKDLNSDRAYYCLECKLSTCEKCTLKEHKGHNIILKKNFFAYDPNLFIEAENALKDAYDLEKEKSNYIKDIENLCDEIHNTIDIIKNKKIKEIEGCFEFANTNLKEFESDLKEIKSLYESFLKNNRKFFNLLKNSDKENSIFLIHYDLKYLCNTRNQELVETIQKMNNDFTDYRNSFNSQKQKIIKVIEELLGLNEPKQKYDSSYWDIKQRLTVYNEHINKLKNNIYEILKQSRGKLNLKELVNILDSKNKKGIQYIFNQDYNAKEKLNIDDDNISNKIIKNKPKEKGSSSKKFIFNKYNTKSEKGTIENDNTFPKTRRYRGRSSNKNLKDRFVSPKDRTSSTFHFNDNSNISYGNNTQTDYTKSLKDLGILSSKDIILDDNTKRKYFAYSIIDLYNRLFSLNPKKSFDNNTRIYTDYKQRNLLIKEYVKPIVGTNEIMMYNSLKDKASKVKVPLIKEQHGYEKFPAGCRHLCVNGNLYICGGVDQMNKPISTALIFSCNSCTIKKMDNMLVPHSYHSMEYLENYDCIVVMGGEYCKSVEIFDIFTKKWSLLPSLNIPRTNINIYFDSFTSELYALFGGLGQYSEKHCLFSEDIEVLELNDIASGWYKVDYYKGSSFNIIRESVTILPFTRTKLLIYGGKRARENEKLFGIYLIDKMELIKSDEDIINKIKYEQKKMKAVNNIYSKLSQ